MIHLDLCGPMPIPYYNCNTFLITFFDECTIMCWVYLLKKKYEVVETIKKFHVWVKNEAQYQIGTIHIDNGKEYTSNDFLKLSSSTWD